MRGRRTATIGATAPLAVPLLGTYPPLRRIAVGRPRSAEREEKGGTHALFALDVKLAAHPSGELPADGQAQSRTAFAAAEGAVHLNERLEDAVEVRHIDQRGPARRGEFRRVSEQVEQDLPELLRVGPNQAWRRRREYLVGNSFRRELGLGDRGYVCHHFREVHRTQVIRDAATLHLRHIEHVLDERQQVFLRALDPRQRRLLLRGHLPVKPSTISCTCP